MPRISDFLLVFLLVSPVGALSKTASECADIKERYGVIAPGCAEVTLNLVAAPSPLAEVDEPASGMPAEITQQQLQDHVFFPAGGVGIDASAAKRIAMIARILQTQTLRDTCIRLVGHSDASGSETGNLEIGLKQAQAVSTRLGQSIGDTRVVSVISQGEWQPLANLDGENNYQRRVEVQLRRCG